MTKRPVIRNIHVTQILKYRLPPAGIVSIMHRASGLLIFVVLPFGIWLFDKSLTSQASFDGYAGEPDTPSPPVPVDWQKCAAADAGRSIEIKNLRMDEASSPVARWLRCDGRGILLRSRVRNELR